VERGQAYRFLVKASSKTAEDWYPSAWGADSTTLTVVEQ
jgi:hypothetical protein